MIGKTLVLLTSLALGLAASVSEEGKGREMPQQYPGGYGYDFVPQASAPVQGYQAAPAVPQYGATAPYTNPGFSVQTGFEGFLVPNSWYGLLPWGVEGVVVVIVGVIVFIVLAVGILGLLAWLTGFGDYSMVKESARSLTNHVSFETLTDVTNHVLDALDKYDELQAEKIK